jgi:signal transduction histidine kinase
MSGENLILEVQDNGRGFSTVSDPHSLGLRGMRERVTPLGGEITIESYSNVGTRIIMTIPHVSIPSDGTKQ